MPYGVVTSEQLLMSAIILIPLSLIPAYIAKQKGRSFLLWYIYGYLFFIVALMHSLMIAPKVEEKKQSIKNYAVPSDLTINKCRINYSFIGCPLDALSYSITANPQQRKMTATINLFAEKPIKAFDVTLEILDNTKNKITDKTFSNVTFGESVDFDISEYAYAKYIDFTFNTVYLENGEEWVKNGERIEYNIDLVDGYELERLKQLTNRYAVCLPYKTEDYWVCSCSKANNTDTCMLCGMDKDELFSKLDKDTILDLKNDLIRRNNLRDFNVRTSMQ